MQLPPRPVPLSPDHLQAGLDALRATFLAHLGPEGARRFVPPPGLLEVLCAAGGAAYEGRVTFLSLASMMAETAGWLSLTPADEPDAADGPWLQVASFGDKHWLFLCCDASHPEYGHIAEGYDVTPWMDASELDYDLQSVLDPWDEGAGLDPAARWTLAGLLDLLAPRWS